MSRFTEQLMREDLPYGVRVFSDGTQELFNRHYETIKSRGSEQSKEVVDQIFFYSDSNPPWRSEITRRRCELILSQWSLG